MTTPFPFSGLSLFIHLTIIFVASVLGMLGVQRKRLAESGHTLAVSSGMKKNHGMSHVLSLFIIGFISTLIVGFFMIAVGTGMQTGTDEWHRQYIRQAASFIRDGEYISTAFSYDRVEKTDVFVKR